MNYLILTIYSTESIQNVVFANRILIVERNHILFFNYAFFNVFKLIDTLRNGFVSF